MASESRQESTRGFEPRALLGVCRAHGHHFQVDAVHEPCPEPGCDAACDYYELIPDAALKAMTLNRPQLWEKWRYKPNRGSGAFTVVRVAGDRVTLRDWRGKGKTISIKTLRGDYERA